MFSLIAFIVSLALEAICYLLQPQTKKSTVSPATLNDLDVPTCTEGNQIPVVFGKRYVDPNVVWYGNFGASAIRKSSGAGKK